MFYQPQCEFEFILIQECSIWIWISGPPISPFSIDVVIHVLWPIRVILDHVNEDRVTDRWKVVTITFVYLHANI